MKKALLFITGAIVLLVCLQVQAQSSQTYTNQASGSPGSRYSCSGPTNNYTCTLLLNDGSGRHVRFTFRAVWYGNIQTNKGTGFFTDPEGTVSSVKWTLSQVPEYCGDGYTLNGNLSDSAGDAVGNTSQNLNTHYNYGCSVSDSGGTTTVY